MKNACGRGNDAPEHSNSVCWMNNDIRKKNTFHINQNRHWDPLLRVFSLHSFYRSVVTVLFAPNNDSCIISFWTHYNHSDQSWRFIWFTMQWHLTPKQFLLRHWSLEIDKTHTHTISHAPITLEKIESNNVFFLRPVRRTHIT